MPSQWNLPLNSQTVRLFSWMQAVKQLCNTKTAEMLNIIHKQFKAQPIRQPDPIKCDKQAFVRLDFWRQTLLTYSPCDTSPSPQARFTICFLHLLISLSISSSTLSLLKRWYIVMKWCGWTSVGCLEIIHLTAQQSRALFSSFLVLVISAASVLLTSASLLQTLSQAFRSVQLHTETTSPTIQPHCSISH